ncbi:MULTISPECIES: hypothetical protein [Methylobacterium]|uniref:Uncharacterized protein n=1 Tax=Methylobacterium bullatum TaxID=570505 RepID=A0AAV4ZBU0_9HYPH|nr:MULTISPECIES: hypothetical protein [Methylobacterium]KQP53056.1 hypothetical protein ASF34_01415 [Methylobacterium sp. Leaf106]MBD8902758.1 hypothetical protein [Methylobacterium bullatum]GJD41336.1 hypothetical protein OICFNHDK_3819 [Methylobacterium bullatum]
MNVVDFTRHQEDRAAAAWDSYVRARDAAEHSRNLSDGIAAGKAWRTFLTLFQTPEQTAAHEAVDHSLAQRRRG